MPMHAARRRQIRSIFEKFLQRRIAAVSKLQLEDLDINPYLIRVLSHELGLNNSRSIVQWLLAQRMERGMVTSFGLALQDAAKVFSEGTGVEGADVMVRKKGVRYYIQVKSGPNTVPKDLAARITDLLRSAQKRNEGSAVLYGMCYGNKDQVSSIVKKYVGEAGHVRWLSGREFWEFVSDDPECFHEIFQIAAEVGESFRDPHGRSLSQVIDQKLAELTAEFEDRYGKGGDSMWHKILEANT